MPALVWNSYRAVASGAIGGVAHYDDEQAQSIWLDGGLKTAVTEVTQGHWREAVYGDPITVTSDAYTFLRLDQAAVGTLHGVALLGGAPVYLRYVYAADISAMVADGQLTAQVDNPITQLSVTVKNVVSDIFTASGTLYNPGAKLTLSFSAGDSEPTRMVTAYVDDLDVDIMSPTVPISARNSTGYLLASQTFDENTHFDGLSHEIFAQILTLGGVKKTIIDVGTGTKSFDFSPSQSLLDGLNVMFQYYDTWRMAELADGTIVIGSDAFVSTYAPRNYYQFDGGSEVFSRRTSKSADAAYTHVMVAGGEGTTPVKRAVNAWDYWALGARKTYHAQGVDGMTQAELASYADALAAKLQYVGIGESFDSPLRPWLAVGDVAKIKYGAETPVSLGLVTEVRHRFGEGGFYTGFSVDSGGSVTDGAEYLLESHASQLLGYNRRQRVIDFMNISYKKNKR